MWFEGVCCILHSWPELLTPWKEVIPGPWQGRAQWLFPYDRARGSSVGRHSHADTPYASSPGRLGNLCDFPVTSSKGQPHLPQTEAPHALLGQAWSLLLCVRRVK